MIRMNDSSSVVAASAPCNAFGERRRIGSGVKELECLRWRVHFQLNFFVVL